MTGGPDSLAVARSLTLALAVTGVGLLVSLLVVAVVGLALVSGDLRLSLLDEVLGDLDDVEDEALDYRMGRQDSQLFKNRKRQVALREDSPNSSENCSRTTTRRISTFSTLGGSSYCEWSEVGQSKSAIRGISGVSLLAHVGDDPVLGPQERLNAPLLRRGKLLLELVAELEGDDGERGNVVLNVVRESNSLRRLLGEGGSNRLVEVRDDGVVCGSLQRWSVPLV